MRTPPTVMPALITPFDADGEIDLDAHGHNLKVLSDRSIEGFLLAGSTGEGPYIEVGERKTLVAATREALGDRPFIVCGVAAESLRTAVAFAAEAAEAGADAVLVMTPTTLTRGREEWVTRFFKAVADASPLPVMLYSVPAVTAYELPVDVVTALTGHPNIVGMKDSGGQPVRVAQILGAAPEGFYLFAGASAALALSVVAGAHGAITASTNYAPRLVREVVSSARKGFAKARDAQERLTGLSKLVEVRGISGVKLAAEVSGLRAGLARPPVWPVDEDNAAALRRRLEVMKGQLLG